MPIAAPTGSGVSFQVGVSSQPATTQLNFRQMAGEVQQWNPEAPPTMIARWIQNAYRRLIDERNWYGTLVKGIISVPDVYSTGIATFTNGSTAVTGVGTAWDNTFVGRQIRVGFSTPFYTIKSVEGAGALTMDLPWGEPTFVNTGYLVFQSVINLGNNVKRLEAMVNQRQGWRLWVNLPQEVTNIRDTWRAAMGFTYACSNYMPSADGSIQWELYPAPTSQQSFPFSAFVQPPDISDDNPFPLLGLRSDVLVMMAIPDALLFRSRNSKYYDPQTAQVKRGEAQIEIEKMKRADDNMWLADLQWNFGAYPMAAMGGGSVWNQSHEFYPG